MTSAVRLFAPRAPAAALLAACVVIGVGSAVRPTPALGVLVLCLAAAVVVAWPGSVAPAVVFLVYVNVPAVMVNDHGVPRTLGALVPLLLVVPVARHLMRREQVVVTPVFALLLLYFAVQVGSAFVSTYPSVASQKLLTFALEGVATYFLVTNAVRTTTALRRAVWAIVAAGAALGLLTCFQQATHTYWRLYGGFSLVDPSYFYRGVGSPRAAGPIGDPNYYGQILVAALALALVLAVRERTGRLRLLAAAAAATIAVAAVLTSSRGTGVAVAVVLLVLALFRYVTKRQLVVVAAGAAVLLVGFSGYRAHLMSLAHLGAATAPAGSQATADLSVQGRAQEMLAAALVFANHPVAGVGPAEFPLYYQQYAAAQGSGITRTVAYGPDRGAPDPRASHDMFLSVAAEVGAVGLLVFGAIIVESLRTLRHVRRSRDPELAALAMGILAAIAGYLAAGLFLTLAYERYFWLLLALAGAAGAVARARGERA